MTQKDLITRIDTRLQGLETQFSNHLRSHFRYSLMAWSIALSAIVSLICLLLQK